MGIRRVVVKERIKNKMRMGIKSRNVSARTQRGTKGEGKELWYVSIIKSLLGAYVVSGMFLLVLAFLLYRFELGESQVAIGIIVIYICSNFCGGFLCGKCRKEQKYLWGMLVGLLYVVLLFFITLGVYQTMNQGDIGTTLILCIASSTVGGMLS